MSRVRSTKATPSPCFPRVSGDEPDLTEIIEAADPFSPRERG